MKKKFTRIAVAAALLLPTGAYAQNVDLSTGGKEATWTGVGAGARAGFILDHGPLSPGDNRRDLVVGAPGSPSAAGKVHVIFGGPVPSGTLSLSSSSVTVTGAAAGDGFGSQVAIGPVLVNDTSLTSNLIVGAPGALGGRGAVYVFATPMATGNYTAAGAAYVIHGAPGDQLGTALATADINNDGYREIVIGAPGNSRIYVIAGGTHLTGTRDLAVTGGDLLINGVGIGRIIQAGDVTGDGVYEILIGSPIQNAMYLLTGGYPDVSNLPADADVVFSGVDPGDAVGASIRLGDFDGDGLRDFIIGAPGADGPGNSRGNAGEAYLFWNRPSFTSGSATSADVTFIGAVAGYETADGLASGDINRDTPNDIVFLVPNAGAAGEAHVYYGRNRTAFGTDAGGGRRLVDLAVHGASRRIIGNPADGRIVSAQVYEVTGEGARDIIIGVPSNNSDVGAVYFVMSPKMVANPLNLAVTLTQGQSTTRTITIDNVSTIPVTFTIADNQPWMSVSPSSGTASSGAVQTATVTINAGVLAPGVHNGNVSFTSTSTHLEMTLTVPVQLTVNAAPIPPAPPSTAKNDFNGDGNMDLLWQNISNGYLAVWSLNGTSLLSSDLLSPQRITDNNWRIVGTGDFNGDLKPDILWQEQTQGWIGIWLMNGTTLLSSTTLSPGPRERVADINWKIAGVVDINNDTKPDIIWQEQTQGWLAAWLMNGTTVTASIGLSPERVSDTNWKIVASGDFNGDGKNDLIWQNFATGYLAAWFMNGTTLIDSVLLSPRYVTDVRWRIVAAGDVNGDGKMDLVWQDPTEGWLAIWLMNGTTLSSSVGFNPERVSDTTWKIVGPK